MNARESIEHSFRHRIVYPVLRSVFRNPVCQQPVRLDGIKRMLVFRHDRIGDMIVTLPLFRALKRRAPGLELTVVASNANAELAQCCKSVDEVRTLETNLPGMVSQLLELRRRRFDVVMNFVFNQTTIPGIRANLIAPDAVKIGQGPDKYAFYFNRLVKVPRFERHMTEQLAVFVESAFGFQLAPDELQLGIDVPDEQQAKVDTWLREHSLVRNAGPATYGLPYAVFNLSVRESDRGLSEEQAAGVCALLCRSGRFRTVVMFDPQNSQAAAMVAARPEFKSSIVFRTDGTSPLLQIASLIGGAIAVVTPDTSVIHFASAMQTPVCGIYGQDYKGVEWGPFRVRHRIIRAEAEGPTSSISVGELTNEVDGFVEDILSDERRR